MAKIHPAQSINNLDRPVGKNPISQSKRVLGTHVPEHTEHTLRRIVLIYRKCTFDFRELCDFYRVLDSRPRGRGFEPHQRHCVVNLEQDTFILA